jgi:hypothetical protein
VIDPKLYSRVFERDTDSQLVLDHLTAMFWKNPYRDDDRDPVAMAYRAGQMSVLDHIINHLNEAHNGDDT